MRRQMIFHGLSHSGYLEPRLAPAPLVASVMAPQDDDPLPHPDPSPEPLPPEPEPTDPFPGLPPSGPAGPGTS